MRCRNEPLASRPAIRPYTWIGKRDIHSSVLCRPAKIITIERVSVPFAIERSKAGWPFLMPGHRPWAFNAHRTTSEIR